MNDKLDKLLDTEILSIPDNFAVQVMKEINQLPMPAPKKTWKEHVQWLAIFGSATLGMVEVFSFIFGIWTATTAY